MFDIHCHLLFGVDDGPKKIEDSIAMLDEASRQGITNIILTPHLAECSRLVGKSVEEIRESLIETSRELSEEYDVTCVLKDAATVVARKDKKTFVNLSGSPAMAKGGSGDVLCGGGR